MELHDRRAGNKIELLQASTDDKMGIPQNSTVPSPGDKMGIPNSTKLILRCILVPLIALAALALPFFVGVEKQDKPGTKNFCYILCAVEFVLCIGFLLLARPTGISDKNIAENTQRYNYYVGVALMMFVGFGFLMTFNKFCGLRAVGMTMLITCLGVQVDLIMEPICANGWVPFKLDIMALVNGNFAAAACLISFGGIIGKVNPTQLLMLTCLEVTFYCINKQLILIRWLQIVDCGGTIIIHMFGAYFGLTVARILGTPNITHLIGSTYASDLIALLGTVFLWLYWPSFVAGGLPPGTVEAETAITNTVLALIGSTISTFIFSVFFHGKMISVTDIQNATLAGGVSIGAVANLNITPLGAVLIGCLAGEISTIGYKQNGVQEFLLENIGLDDSCGINNLHGMPSLLGGIASILVPLMVEQGKAGTLGYPPDQLLGILFTLLVALVSGALTGLLMLLAKDENERGFDDSMFWAVEIKEVPEPDN